MENKYGSDSAWDGILQLPVLSSWRLLQCGLSFKIWATNIKKYSLRILKIKRALSGHLTTSSLRSHDERRGTPGENCCGLVRWGLVCRITALGQIPWLLKRVFAKVTCYLIHCQPQLAPRLLLQVWADGKDISFMRSSVLCCSSFAHSCASASSHYLPITSL